MAASATVLVADDAPEIVGILRDYLEADGFTVITAAEGKEALSALAVTLVDCVLLDVMMPGASGFEVCRRIREISTVPVLFLTARDADSDKLRGLGLGDDYIVKTASPAEIVARVKAVLRRTRAAREAGTSDGQVIDCGRVHVDLLAHELRVDGHAIPVTAREFATPSYAPPTGTGSPPAPASLPRPCPPPTSSSSAHPAGPA